MHINVKYTCVMVKSLYAAWRPSCCPFFSTRRRGISVTN